MFLRRWHPAGQVAAVFVVYFVAARLSLQLAFVGRNVSPVWPPTGIALSAVLLLGRQVWPGVWMGAFLANLATGVPLAVAMGIGTGNTLEALVAAYLLHSAGFHPSLNRPREVLRFIGLACVMSPLVSATFGIVSLWWGGVYPPLSLVPAWLVWWLGDALGNFLVAPLILIWASPPYRFGNGRAFEAGLLAVVVVGTSLALFTSVIFPGLSRAPLAFLVAPVLLWAALRFGQPGAATAMCVTNVVATWGTAHGQGAFGAGSVLDGLVLVQLFSASYATLALLVAATDTERRVAIQLRDDFVAIASHELRSPLTSAGLALAQMQRGPERLPALVAMASRGIERAGKLVDTLLDVSRISSRSLVLDFEPVNLADLAREVASRFRPLAEEAGCELVVLAEDPVVGHWDRSRLEQVLTNLLSNATKFGAGNPVEISVRRVGSRARLGVRDRGRGIAAQEQQQIFGRYQRAGSARDVKGLGLGLYITRQIVEAMDGVVRVHSEPGAGADFAVELPLFPLQVRGALRPGRTPGEFRGVPESGAQLDP